jgi:phosphotransferase system  glucose/maltose/N-acetylglucosamine-specific IIC component
VATHDASVDITLQSSSKLWYAAAALLAVGAAGVGWSLAQVAGAAGGLAVVIAGAVVLRRRALLKARAASPTGGTGDVTPKVQTNYTSQVHTALLDSGTRSGIHPIGLRSSRGIRTGPNDL